MKTRRLRSALVFAGMLIVLAGYVRAADTFEGQYYRGEGDREYLQFLDISRRMFDADPEFQNLTMLYEAKWNGFVEGPTWDAWWVQNSYGTTYCALPFLQEPYVTFLQNAQDLWFDQMGDGKRAGANGWVAPDGYLCDCARPGWIMYKQGDGRIDIHDWGMEFTAAGLLMQAELLLISRDEAAIAKYLPKLERCANFIETRRDPKNNMFLAGPAGNLLAPSYAGWPKADGSFGQAYLSGLSVTYIGALDRLISLEQMMNREEQVKLYLERREAAREGLKNFIEPEGYLVRSIDPDGTRHGVFGAKKHGYLETSPNHDAIAFSVLPKESKRMFEKIISVPQLRPHAFILPNYPSYDDMYTTAEGLWGYGTWVNGGHWSTCEARMMMAYSIMNDFESNRRSMKQLMKFARDFRMDNPLTQMGNAVYQPNEAINLCYDSLGPAAALMRGLFEYRYTAVGLELIPHVPPGITELHQLHPILFGKNRVFVSCAGIGKINQVRIDGTPVFRRETDRISLHYDDTLTTRHVSIGFGDAAAPETPYIAERGATKLVDGESTDLVRRAAAFRDKLSSEGLRNSYAWEHADLVCRASNAGVARKGMEASHLPERTRAAAVDSYTTATTRLAEGLKLWMEKQTSGTGEHQRVSGLWGLGPQS